MKAIVSREEFDGAEAFGEVYGKVVTSRPCLYIYAELGDEKPYRNHPKDDPKTSYRYFTGCKVNIAKTEEQIDLGNFEAILTNTTLIIYT